MPTPSSRHILALNDSPARGDLLARATAMSFVIYELPATATVSPDVIVLDVPAAVRQ